MDKEKKYPIKTPEEIPFREKRYLPGIIEGFDKYELQAENHQNLNNINNMGDTHFPSNGMWIN